MSNFSTAQRADFPGIMSHIIEEEEQLDGQTRLYSSHDTTQHTHAATHTLMLTVAGEI